LVKSEEGTHSVKCAERSGAELEILPACQWFIKVLEYKDELLAKVKKCNWHPKSMQKRKEICVVFKGAFRPCSWQLQRLKPHKKISKIGLSWTKVSLDFYY
jgi:hypothetical protein